jgi:hypothetical protein
MAEALLLCKRPRLSDTLLHSNVLSGKRVQSSDSTATTSTVITDDASVNVLVKYVGKEWNG